jgi:hypothetical protein
VALSCKKANIPVPDEVGKVFLMSGEVRFEDIDGETIITRETEIDLSTKAKEVGECELILQTKDIPDGTTKIRFKAEFD